MKVSHLVSAILVSVAAALVGNLFVAPYSTDGYAALEAHKERLEANLADLRSLHATLEGRIELLTRSSDAIRVEARGLGYYGPDETVIRINNSHPTLVQSPGRIILGQPVAPDRRSLVRITSILIGAIAFVVLLLLDRSVNHRSMSRPSR